MKATAPQIVRDHRSATETNVRLFRTFRPRFLYELVVVPFKDEVIIEGTERLQTIQSPAGPGMLSDLIGLIDGDRTLDELKSALPGMSEEDVLAAISSLYRFGLIEDGAAGSQSEYPNPDTLAFMRRYVAVTAANRSGAEAYERLRNSEVLVFGSDDGLSDAECLRGLLVRTGVGSVVPLKRMLPSAWRPRSTSITQSMVISLSFHGEDREWHEQMDDWCFKHQLPWLRLVLSKKENYADLGPIFNAERTPCYRCLQEVHSVPHHSGCELNESEIDVQAAYWIGMAAVESIYFLSRIGPLMTERFVDRYDLQQHTSRRLHLLRVPGCSRCRPLPQEQVSGASTDHAIGAIDSAVVFEDYISLSSRPRTPSVIQEDYARLSKFLVRQVKRMPNCTLFHLPRSLSGLERPALESLNQPVDAHRRVITVNDLSTILMLTAGIRDLGEQKVQRWTATAGNLGSVELFVIAHRVDGLASGIYFYEAHDHSLAHFQQRDQTSAIPELIQRMAVIDSADLPDVLVLFTGAYHRLERKYGEFAYKLVNLDAGVAVSQLHYVAKSLGLSSLTALRWADDLIEQQLNLEPRQEQVTAVVALYPRSGAPSAAVHRTDDSIPGPRDTALARRPSDFCELGLREVGERLFWESRIHQHHLRSSPPKCSLASRAVTRGPSLLLRLPAPEGCGGVSVGDVLAQRITVRNYTGDPVSPAQLATILDLAYRGDQEQWKEEHVAQPLTFYVLAWNLAQFEPGVYVYDAEEHGLRSVAPARSLHESMDLFVQPEFASAAVVIWITGNLAVACARLGSLGHRYLLLRAGSAGHRLWTAALAMRLSGGITAGLVSGVAREQFGVDGYQQASLLAFATGIEAEEFRESSGTVPDEESE